MSEVEWGQEAMQSYSVLIIFVAYFAVLLLISHLVSRKSSGNDAFFRADRRSPWWVVAIGMIGTSISGVTFVSVPGMVRDVSFGYMQMVLGFFFRLCDHCKSASADLLQT